MSAPNDEPVYQDALGHHALARRVGHRLLKCRPPYVVGVCGSWGAGKTSFLQKLWAYLGGDFETPAVRRDDPKWKQEKWRKARLDEIREAWFGEKRAAFDQLLTKDRELELIWFNPWQHQFESSPLVALLHEIRRHFTLKRRLLDEAGKLADVSLHAVLNSVTDVAKDLFIPLPTARTVMERGREYEAERFSTPLTSQRFRDLFESAISEITQGKGRLVIFIDDLDRCEGETAYRLLESLKLYLNAKNCVYVLGLDQQHLETSIAKALSGEKETWRYRPIARDYLNKIFQNLFLLPVPRATHRYVEQLLRPEDDPLRAEFESQLAALFDFTGADWPALVRALDENLPHNPRKIKAFIYSWRLHLDALPENPPEKLDWRLSLVLHYLAQFEEPLFRKVEEAPSFYNDVIVKFCQENVRSHYLLDDGLELPYEMVRGIAAPGETGEYGVAQAQPDRGAEKGTESKPLVYPRVFWVSNLINSLAAELGPELPGEMLLRHLLHAGGALDAKAPEAGK
jgi:hypothetical protein